MMELAEAIARGSWIDPDWLTTHYIEQDAYDRSIKAQRTRRVR